MVMDLEELALELVSTHLDPFMSPDPLRVLEREVLMLSQATTHRTIGHQLLLHMAPPPVMDILAMVMDLVLMVTELVVSALELVSTLLAPFMNPDLLRVLVNVALMLNQDTLVLDTDMVMVLVASALVLVSTHLGQSMSPDLPRVSAVD